MTQTTAIKDLIRMEIDALSLKKDEIFEFFLEKFPTNLAGKISSFIIKLWDYSYEIAANSVSIGKIVISHIYKFILENPNMSFGMALGAIAGSLLSIFINWIPFIGQALSALIIGSGILIGALSGSRLDKISNNELVDNSVISIFGDTIYVATKFSKLLIDIINSIKS